MIQAVLVGPSTDCVLRGEAHMGEGKLLDVAATKTVCLRQGANFSHIWKDGKAHFLRHNLYL